jgi:hypothetical protein
MIAPRQSRACLVTKGFQHLAFPVSRTARRHPRQEGDENGARVLVSEMMKVTCGPTVTPLNVCRREPAELVTAPQRI